MTAHRADRGGLWQRPRRPWAVLLAGAVLAGSGMAAGSGAAALAAVAVVPAAAGPPPSARGMQVVARPDSAAGPELQVRVAAAPEMLRRPGWAAGWECAVERASGLLWPVMGRRLRAQDRVPWRLLTPADELRALRARLVEDVEHGGADLVVGLIGVDPAGGSFVEDGLASYSRGYLVLRVGPDLCAAGGLLAHEIAHVFGGVHRAGADNLMDPTEPGERIDELNAALLGLHRERLIREQEPPLRGPQLRMMWRLARADLEDARTWLRVGVLAVAVGKPEPACGYYERALELRPELRVGWMNLGHARLQLGRLQLAEQAYERARTLDDADGLLHNNLAVIYLSTGRPRRAAAALERALDLGYPVPDALRQAVAAAQNPVPFPQRRSPCATRCSFPR